MLGRRRKVDDGRLTGLLLQPQRPPTMAPSSAKAKRLPNFKLLHEREQARVERFKVRARALAALSDKRPLLRRALSHAQVSRP